MRVLTFSWEYPPLLYGGLGRHVHELSEAMASAGHEVVVITQRHADAPDDSHVNGVRIVRTEPPESAPSLEEDIVGWVDELNTAFSHSVQTSLEGWRPDVVHGHDWLVARSSIEAARAHGCPLVATVHATASGQYRGDLSKARTRGRHEREVLLTGNATRTIVCSTAMQDEVVQALGADPARVVIAPNAVNPGLWATTPSERTQARTAVGVADRAPLLVLPGRLKVFKGGDVAIDALHLVRRTYPDAHLVFAGVGDHQARLEEHVARLGLDGSVHFVGHLDVRELAALMATADAALFPSSYEPFGNGALEAMAAGTAVVAAETGGLTDFVYHDRTGLVVPPDAPQALAAQVERLLSDEGLGRELVSRSQEHIAARYTSDAVARQVVDVYDTARNETGASAAPTTAATHSALAAPAADSSPAARDDLLTRMIESIKSCRNILAQDVGAALTTLHASFTEVSTRLASIDPSGALTTTTNGYKISIDRLLVDSRDTVDEILHRKQLELFDVRWRLRGGTEVPTILGPVSTTRDAEREQIRAALEPIRDHLPELLIAVDYDGTLADMLPRTRPWETVGLPYTPAYLQKLSQCVRRVAIITGRPLDQVLKVGNLGGSSLVVVGGNGLSRWNAGRLEPTEIHPALPEALARSTAAVRAIAADHPRVYVEDKTHAVAMHALSDDPVAAHDHITAAGHAIATDLGLELMVGAGYVEIRPPGVDKGIALRHEVESSGAQAVFWAGDQSNDRPAFKELRRLADQGIPTVGVCCDAPSADEEVRAVADLRVPGAVGLHRVFREIISMSTEQGA